MKLQKITYQIPHLEYYREHTEALIEDTLGVKKSYTKEDILEIAESLALTVAADVYFETNYPDLNCSHRRIYADGKVVYKNLEETI